MTCLSPSEMLELAGGILPATRQDKARQHLLVCARCREIAEEHSRTISRLAPDPGEIDNPEFVAQVMTLVDIGHTGHAATDLRSARLRRRVAFFSGIAACLVAGVAAFLLYAGSPRQSEPGAEGFRSRDGLVSDDERWTGFSVYRATPHGYTLCGERVDSGDALAFGYVNSGPRPFGHLMIFAVDEKAQIFWYYPAYQAAGTNPVSVSIKATTAPTQLQDEVSHPLAKGALRIFAVFSRRPLAVLDIERAVRRDLAVAGDLKRLGRIDLPDTAQQSYLFWVNDSAKRDRDGS